MKKLLTTMFVFILIVSWEPHRMLQAQQVGPYSIEFSWEIPTLRTDDTPLLNLAGFKLYQSAESGVYPVDPVSDIANPSINLYVLDGVNEGQWYFVVTAYDADGLESDVSNEVTKTIVGPNAPPKSPTGLAALLK